ncbi:MAG TPA: DUF2339 domain-containing protein [Chthoniobacterales bacterium]|nr:DUF2339 domain-containing protein [Chthoniobacterales bacterium]
MDPSICLGLVFLLVPIVLIVVGVVEIQKLKKTVRELGSRIGALESRGGGVVAPAAPVQTPKGEPVSQAVSPPPVPTTPRAVTPPQVSTPPVVPEPARPKVGPSVPPPLPPPKATAPPPPPPPRPVPQIAKPIDWEAFFGVKLFAWIGGFVLFLGIVFLVKYSFENNLITPGMRVAIGAVVGVGLIVTGWLTATRRYRVSGQSLCATGVLVLYGNIFAAHVFYHLIALVPAFISMAIVTAAAFFLAVRMNAQVIVVLGLLGGFLTPGLLSTGVDNPIALFGYIAVLNIGIAAVALRKRWDYLVALAALGTALTEVAWGWKFFEYPKANIAFVVFLGFEAQFLAIFAAYRRKDPAADRVVSAVLLVAFTALAAAFTFLDYPELGRRPGFLFSFAFLAEAGLLALVFLRSKSTAFIAPASGFIVFAFLAGWTGRYLNDALLWWGLGGYVVFALLHAGFAFRRKEDAPSAEGVWPSYVPLLALVLICVCVGKSETSAAVWLCLLVLNIVAVGAAFVRRSLPAVAIALVVTIFAAALWILTAPPEIDLRGFLIVAAGSGAFFFSAALFAGRKFFPESENVRRNLPALAAAMPFLLLLMAMAKLPIVNPTPFFITAFFLAVLLLGLGVVTRTSWIALIALAFTWAVEREWQAIYFTDSYGALAIGWQVAFFLLFLGYPFFTAEDRKPLPWAIGALSGLLHFGLIYEIIRRAFPNLDNGLVPAAFILPYAIGTLFLVKRKQVVPASGDARLAWQAGAALFFVNLIFPIQFDREWITIGWALEGFALLWLFRVVPHRGLRYVGVGLLCVAFVRLALNPAVLEYHPRAATPVWNWYLYGYGLPILCLFGGAWLFRSNPQSAFERKAPTLLNSLGAILTFLLLNIEIADYFSVGPTLTFSFSGNFARDMTYSIAWALFAFVLLLVGMKQKTGWVRYAGVVLLLVTLLKLFLHDLGSLSQLYRIGAFIGVAVILIVASFVYQRFLVPKSKDP